MSPGNGVLEKLLKGFRKIIYRGYGMTDRERERLIKSLENQRKIIEKLKETKKKE